MTDILKGNTNPSREPDLGGQARDPQRAGRHAPAGRGQDRDRDRRARPVHVRLSRAAREPEGAGAGDRRVAGQQRPFDAAVVEPGDLAHRRRAAVAIGRARAHRRPAGDRLRAARAASSGSRIDAWSGGAPGPWTRQTRTELFRVGTQPGARNAVDPAGPPVQPVVRRLGRRPGQGGARSAVVGCRRRRLARPRAGGRRRRRSRSGSRTAFFWGRTGWGGPLLGACFVPSPRGPRRTGTGTAMATATATGRPGRRPRWPARTSRPPARRSRDRNAARRPRPDGAIAMRS